MGRAGRTQAGHCIRLWKEHEILPERTPPEILRTDITQLVLECTQWGITDRLALDWLDAPPQNAWNSSVAFLERVIWGTKMAGESTCFWKEICVPRWGT